MESLHKLKKMMCRELDEISNKGDMGVIPTWTTATTATLVEVSIM